MAVEFKRVMKTASYYYGANFSNFPSFFSKIDNNGELIDDYNDTPWRKMHIANDVANLKVHVNKTEFINLVRKFYSMNGPVNQYEKIVHNASQFLKFTDIPNLYLVDMLPYPFTEKAWDAVSVDKDDSKNLNIPYGIYFVKSSLTHCYFEFVIAHELVHWAISEHSLKYYPYVPLLEEGICDVIGSLILLNCCCLPLKAITNLFIYNRGLKSPDSLWKSYWDSCKKIIFLLINTSIEEVINLIKSGRESIVSFDFNKINESNTAFVLDGKIKKLVLAILKANITSELPIDDYAVLNATLELKQEFSIDIREIINYLKMPEDKVQKSLDKLCDLGYISIGNNNILQINKYISDLRYQI